VSHAPQLPPQPSSPHTRASQLGAHASFIVGAAPSLIVGAESEQPNNSVTHESTIHRFDIRATQLKLRPNAWLTT
jgi:hypothetical protein